FPEPDSPTMPTFSRPTSKEMPRTASITRCGVRKLTRSSSATSSGFAGASAMARVEHVAQAVAEEVEGEADAEYGEARHGGQPPAPQHVLPPGREHGAPFGQRRLRAEAEEAEPRRGQDDAGHVEGDAHDDRGDAHRHDMLDDDAPGPRALDAD